MTEIANIKNRNSPFFQGKTAPYTTKTVNSGSTVQFHYYGARYLDPKTSRWLSTDPALGEYVPVAPLGENERKHNSELPGLGGVFNLVNLHVYHYAGNNPVRYYDPDGRSDLDVLIENAKNNSWENPVFIIGLSANATGPLMSVGNTSGLYFIPESMDDPVFHTAFTSFMSGNLALKPIALIMLIASSSDYGVFTDILSGGSGGTYPFGVTGSFGGTVGIFRSIDDLRGAYNETGVSVTVSKGLGVSVGIDVIFNSIDIPVGFTLTVGIGASTTPLVIAEGHSRFGHTFVVSARERMQR